MTVHEILGENLNVAMLDDVEFRELVKADCFKRERDDLYYELRSDENIERFLTCLKMLQSDLDSQLSEYRQSLAIGDRERDDDWRRRVLRLRRAVNNRLIEVRAQAAERRRRAHLATSEGVWTQLRKLRYAIQVHRERVTTDGYEPTDADMQLWSALDAMGEE